MSSHVEAAKIKAEVEKLESAFQSSTDSIIREVIRVRIEECRTKLRQLQTALRSSLRQ
jgi:hypothetical protein